MATDSTVGRGLIVNNVKVCRECGRPLYVHSDEIEPWVVKTVIRFLVGGIIVAIAWMILMGLTSA